LIQTGARVQQGWSSAAAAQGLPIHVGGMAPLGHFSVSLANGQAVRTLFTQHMLDRGFLATGAFYAMYAHTHDDVSRYLDAVHEVFGLVAQAARSGMVEAELRGPVAHAGFQRLT